MTPPENIPENPDSGQDFSEFIDVVFPVVLDFQRLNELLWEIRKPLTLRESIQEEWDW